MKANDFIKEYGLVEAIEYLKQCDGLDHVYMGNSFYIDDLKRLIESHELVEKMGGINLILKNKNYFYSDEVKQAIADVESCQ